MASQEATAEKATGGTDPTVDGGTTQPLSGGTSPSPSPASSTPASNSNSNNNNKVEVQLADAERFKDEGNALYAKGDVKGALQKWHYALLHSSGINSFSSSYGSRSTPSQNSRAQLLTAALHSNLSACYLSQGQNEKVLLSCGKVLALCGYGEGQGQGQAKATEGEGTATANTKANSALVVKALYRRAKAQLALGQSQKAAKDIDAAMERAPGDAGVRALAREVVKREEEKLEKQKKEMAGFLKGKELGGGQAQAPSEGSA